MSPNVTLLRNTLAHIEANPDEWDQADWHCGTSACFAGHAAILAGARWEADLYYTPWVIRPDGKSALVETYATQQLGLTYEQRHELFYRDNTLDDLRRIVGELCDGAQ